MTSPDPTLFDFGANRLLATFAEADRAAILDEAATVKLIDGETL